MKIKIVGAGSIGNHMAHGCRVMGWKVTMADVQPAALRRTKEEIYPGRYGSWDPSIRLGTPSDFAGEKFDAVIVGTPPDSHVKVAGEELKSPHSPRVLMIEKPACCPDLSECDELSALDAGSETRVLVGYNHRLTPHTVQAASLIASGDLGRISVLHAGFEEHWAGIFKAHPWLSGPETSYLGFTSRGGGASGEHSHALNLWLYFAQLAGIGQVTEVTAAFDRCTGNGADYDRWCQLLLRTDKGVCGSVTQDVVTEPARKWSRIQGESGQLYWQAAARPDADLLGYHFQNKPHAELWFPRSRPGDFRGELEHLGHLMEAPDSTSPLDISHGLETMLLLCAAGRSARNGSTVRIDRTATSFQSMLKTEGPHETI
jgi:predicted dehydrogenase